MLPDRWRTLDVAGKDVICAANAHVEGIRADQTTVTHQDLLTRGAHRHGDNFRPAVTNALKQRLPIFRFEVTILAADNINIPLTTQLLFGLCQHFGLTANQEDWRPLRARAGHKMLPEIGPRHAGNISVRILFTDRADYADPVRVFKFSRFNQAFDFGVIFHRQHLFCIDGNQRTGFHLAVGEQKIQRVLHVAPANQLQTT